MQFPNIELWALNTVKVNFVILLVLALSAVIMCYVTVIRRLIFQDKIIASLCVCILFSICMYVCVYTLTFEV